MDKRNPGPGQWFLIFLGTGLGSGFSPVAPGTFGSVVGVLLAGLVKSTWPSVFVGAALGVIVLSVPICDGLGKLWNSKDPQRVVLDEIAALFLIQIWFPVSTAGLIVQFLSFRFFDILKPPPCRQGEQLPGGWGIVADDLLAGVYSIATVWLVNRFFPLW